MGYDIWHNPQNREKMQKAASLHHARKPPFSFYMAIENTYPIAAMRFMIFFIELIYMFLL
ncbi:hypothetical protein DW830_08030 [Prevotella sp. AM34-19LB]|nr:hypothetical protein DW830_08030 [Prevotella sp. AM34-19LB]